MFLTISGYFPDVNESFYRQFYVLTMLKLQPVSWRCLYCTYTMVSTELITFLLKRQLNITVILISHWHYYLYLSSSAMNSDNWSIQCGHGSWQGRKRKSTVYKAFPCWLFICPTNAKFYFIFLSITSDMSFSEVLL